MSAMGEKVAFVSLGLSCQTSRQIDSMIPLFREMTGDQTIERVTLPFDWLIATSRGVTQMLRSRDFFPTKHEALIDDHDRLRHRDYDVLYWHESRLHSHEGYGPFATVQGKFAYTSGRLAEIGTRARVVAVFSDTQCNLPEVEEMHGLLLTNTPLADVQASREALEEVLGRPVDLLIVSRNPRPAELPPRTAYYEMTPDLSHWAGSRRDWGVVYKDYLTNA